MAWAIVGIIWYLLICVSIYSVAKSDGDPDPFDVVYLVSPIAVLLILLFAPVMAFVLLTSKKVN